LLFVCWEVFLYRFFGDNTSSPDPFPHLCETATAEPRSIWKRGRQNVYLIIYGKHPLSKWRGSG
jgi:hypothetical protein